MGKPCLLRRRASWGAAAVLVFCAGVACHRQANPAALFASATRCFQQGDKLAQEQAARGYRDFQRQPRSEWYWKFTLLLAEIDLWRGETKQADRLLAESPPPQYPRLCIRRRILSSYVLSRQKKDAQAESELNSAASQAHAIGAWDLEADAELLLGSRMATRDPSDAALRRALQIASERRLPYQETEAWLNLGFKRYRRDLYGDAIPYFERAAELARRMDFRQARRLASQDAADCYREMGDVDRALKIQLEVVKAEEKTGASATLANAYIDLGTSYLIKRDPARGTEYLRKAVDTANPKELPVQFVWSANSLAQALESTGALDQAERYNRLAFGVSVEANREQLAELNLTKAAIAEDRGGHQEAIAAFGQALDSGGETPSIAWEAHAGLGSVYAGIPDMAQARSHFEQALRVIERNRADQLKREYEITFLSTLIRFYQRYVSVLMSNGEVENAIEVADSSRANVLTRSLIAPAAPRSGRLVRNTQRQAKLTNSVYLFYWLAPARSYLWVLTADAVRTIALPDERAITQDVESYLSLVIDEKRDPLAASNAVGRRLYQTLIAPAQAWLPRGAHVVVVPDGALHDLNFEMLVSNKPEAHYWIQDAVISIAPSLSILQTAERAAAASERALLLGDPEAAPGYPRLAHAAAEITSIERHFPAGRITIYRGAAATVESYRAAEPRNFSSIHFAAHAEANPESPLDSAIILSPQPERYKLYARDLTDIPITADLVTISGCRGAGARAYSGEGLVGFAWAFFQAGARNVVASLWDVNDATTAELMNSFYERISLGEPYADALREAKLRMLQAGVRKPYYWAPFQLYTRVLSPAGRAFAVTPPSRAAALRSPPSASQ